MRCRDFTPPNPHRQVTAALLRRAAKGSLLEAVLDSPWAEAAREVPRLGNSVLSASLFVDRDAHTFRDVLAFLRTGRLPRDNTARMRLYDEAAFWQLYPLAVKLERAVARGVAGGAGSQRL